MVASGSWRPGDAGLPNTRRTTSWRRAGQPIGPLRSTDPLGLTYYSFVPATLPDLLAGPRTSATIAFLKIRLRVVALRSAQYVSSYPTFDAHCPFLSMRPITIWLRKAVGVCHISHTAFDRGSSCNPTAASWAAQHSYFNLFLRCGGVRSCELLGVSHSTSTSNAARSESLILLSK